jgi:hypothetical protein
METMLQGLVIVGGLTFSLAASLLIEELIFGRIVRLAFAPRAAEFSVPSSQFSTTAALKNGTRNRKLETENGEVISQRPEDGTPDPTAAKAGVFVAFGRHD